MFAVAYLILVLVSAIPLGRTFLQHRGAPPSVALAHRIYRDLAYIAGSVLVIVVFEMAISISLQNYWFTELGQQYRYWFALGLRVAIFSTVLVFGGLFVAYNLRLACRYAPVVPPSAPWFAGFTISALVALGSIDLWTPLAAFLGAAPSGVTDPVFARDLSFYLLALPLYEQVVGLATTIIVFAMLGWLGVGLVVYPRLMRRWRRRGPQLALVEGGEASETWAADDRPAAVPAKAWDAWLAQGMMLGALLCLAWAVARYFSLYHLVINGRSAVVAGASWGDIRFSVPAYGVTIALWLAAAMVLATAALQPRLRRWLVEPSHLAAAAGVFAAIYVIALIVPAAVEQFYVGPNQITLERPYLVRSIAGTRRAYGLEAPNLEEQTFALSASPISRGDLDNNAATLRDARIWDWRALEPQLQQTQGLRPYYTFSEVDIDRYKIDGDERQVLITARELDVARLPPPAQVWVNLALKYTHGYGVVAVPANEIDDRGNPVLWAHDIPIQAKGDLVVTHGEIYYGMETRNRVYVHTTEKEFDFPRGDANAETVYGGSGGIRLSNFWRRLVIARQFDGLRLFISNYFTSQSRVLIRRNVVERVQRLAPFLSFDRDPYIVADGDHYSYIIDGYTSSENYPYSEAYNGSVAAFHGRNYLRNSVKAVVDAYNGSVTFYVFATDDPIIKAYRKMLPGLFRDRSAMPENLRRHIRYPEDLFTVQAEMYGTYHMTNPTTFYNREDRWEAPRELFRDTEIELAPYYVMAQLPGDQSPEFILMLPLSVAGKNQMAGWLAGRSDGDNYGKLVAFRFPKGRFVDGPAQIESRINSDSRFSGDLSLWDQHGSRVIRGNLIILPLKDRRLVAIEPVYIEAEQTQIPTLARVVFGQLLPDDRKIEWASTLGGAEAILAGAPAEQAGEAPPAATDQDRFKRAQGVFHDMQRAYAAGDFVRYGQLMQDLERVFSSP
ncbi:MAG TPA: UPF0182 family protein [Caulobacteraceae bacterium]|jgi:hypothetical protein|nr:UPF0182 family protein [Caulobacteraceae bacterium]